MRIGSLASGYGGLDMGVQAVLGGDVAWHCEYDLAPSKVLAHHWPDVPNHGDITAIDWTEVEPVDVLVGGYPCQPFSHAGKRRGVEDERHIWPWIADAIRVLRPRLLVFENVAGHLRLGFDTVLADLAAMGAYDVRWGLVRASDTGAPHRRERLWIVAQAADTDLTGLEGWPEYSPRGHGKGRPAAPGYRGDAVAQLVGVGPQAPQPVTLGAEVGAEVAGVGIDGGVDRGDSLGFGGHGSTMPVLAANLSSRLRLLPSPLAGDGLKAAQNAESSRRRMTTRNYPFLTDVVLASTADEFNSYAPAIAQWERVMGRPAPTPVEDNPNSGQLRLSREFTEWMMGLPSGWVTGVPGLSYGGTLKVLGNGVVPAQAALALRLLLGLGDP